MRKGSVVSSASASQNASNSSSIIFAAELGHWDSVQKYLQTTKGVFASNDDDFYLLHKLASQYNQTRVLKLLEQHNPVHDSPTYKALLKTAEFGEWDLVEQVLQNDKVSLEYSKEYFQTLYHYAQSNQKEEVVRLLTSRAISSMSDKYNKRRESGAAAAEEPSAINYLRKRDKGAASQKYGRAVEDFTPNQRRYINILQGRYVEKFTPEGKKGLSEQEGKKDLSEQERRKNLSERVVDHALAKKGEGAGGVVQASYLRRWTSRAKVPEWRRLGADSEMAQGAEDGDYYGEAREDVANEIGGVGEVIMGKSPVAGHRKSLCGDEDPYRTPKKAWTSRGEDLLSENRRLKDELRKARAEAQDSRSYAERLVSQRAQEELKKERECEKFNAELEKDDCPYKMNVTEYFDCKMNIGNRYKHYFGLGLGSDQAIAKVSGEHTGWKQILCGIILDRETNPEFVEELEAYQVKEGGFRL